MKQVEGGNGHIGGWRAERGRTARFCVRYCQAYSSPSHYRLATTCWLFLPSLSSLSHAGCRARMLAHTLTHTQKHAPVKRTSFPHVPAFSSQPASCPPNHLLLLDKHKWNRHPAPFNGTTALNWQSGRGKRGWPRTRGSKPCICADA